MKTLFTHGAILCVCGDRKCTFNTTTVTHILKKIKTIYYKCILVSVLADLQQRLMFRIFINFILLWLSDVF